MADKLSQKLNKMSQSSSKKAGVSAAKETGPSGMGSPVSFPVKDEDPKSKVGEQQQPQPRRKSFLENNNPQEFQPMPRKKRVSSLSLSDQWSAMTPLHPEGSSSKVSRHGSVTSGGHKGSRSRKSSIPVRHRKSVVNHERVASYAFAFDIDGVLVKGPETIPQGPEALRMLNGHNKYNIKVPYIFITNGGGRSEKARCRDLSKRLGITVTEDQVIQGHTPMKDLVDVYENVLVVGGVLDSCRKVAEGYGFKNVYIPLDVMKWKPSVTPYYVLNEEERNIAKDVDFSKINIQAILVFADSRNWAADQQIILELLMSEKGVMGTISPTYDQGPGLYFAHSDFVWATDYGLCRYGMGALQVSIAALYEEHTGKELQVTRFGKPQRGTFRFAEKVLSNWRRETLSEHVENLKLEDPDEGENKETPFGDSDSEEDEADWGNDSGERPGDLVLELPPASTVYFVGDTPESDIRFANSHDSTWYSILVKTGVYKDGVTPRYTPKKTCENVLEAVNFAIEREHAKELKEWNESCAEETVIHQEGNKKPVKEEDDEGEAPLTTNDLKSIRAETSS
ncbi:hypothetical protein ZYGR_0A04140 [Zygosaccharomyces rouxii]|uniref:Phosphatidyl synthase n=1 Tax=Zygosaccharomyces rouxii TaxID=4956 RepID=A0A1Q2ZTM2_ZYGRO|nr:hypothetical protein ZYGR_0A04140 [Zygosaccharomyces rouxii]